MSERHAVLGLYVNGKKICDVQDATYDVVPLPPSEPELDKFFEGRVYALEFTGTVKCISTPRGMPHDWVEWLEKLTWRMPLQLRQEPFRASFETLMRRASYGGRKGRRAMRRLMAMPDSIWAEKLR